MSRARLLLMNRIFLELLAYSYDSVLLEKNKEVLIEQAQELLESAKIRWNRVYDRSEADVHNHLEVGAYKFNSVQEFKYLGTLIIENNEIREEIKARIQAGERSYFGSNKSFGSRKLSESLKMRLCRILIRLAVMYEYENWTLHKAQ